MLIQLHVVLKLTNLTTALQPLLIHVFDTIKSVQILLKKHCKTVVSALLGAPICLTMEKAFLEHYLNVITQKEHI